MATMIKEKRREKKKTKEKYRSSYLEDGASSSIGVVQESSTKTQDNVDVNEKPAELGDISDGSTLAPIHHDNQEVQIIASVEQHAILQENVLSDQASITLPTVEICHENLTTNISQKSIELDSFENLNARLKRMVISDQDMQIDKTAMLEIERIDAYLQSKQNEVPKESHNYPELTALESVVPTAPIFNEQIVHQTLTQLEREIMRIEIPKVECMTLDEAIRISGGKEMAAVKEMSEKEEAEVEAGPNLSPEHPLVDLLSTFRSSIRAMERERTRLASNFDGEEKFRNKLWRVETQKLHLTMPCKCGVDVELKATYEKAELMKEKLPVAKLKLEGLLKDIQESYCHHQHAALLAHCQIEDLVSETITGNKREIRDALSLILQSLRMSDGSSEALPAALQRWAEILASALVDERDLRQLLFVIHHLFRQTRSVRWAARVLRTRVSDAVTAARTLALLDILLSKMHLEAAVECVEETEGGWEEVDIRGGHGAVSPGALRERDLIALVRALPLQQLVAKLVQFSQADFRLATEYDWGDALGGNELLKACCGVRALLSVVQRAVTQHACYARLHAVLRAVACSALTALACLYQSPRVPYSADLEESITVELHAAFAACFSLFGTQELHKLPTTLLAEHAAKDYCLTFIMGLHDKSPKSISSLSVTAPVLACDVGVRVITQAAADRGRDHELARIVLDFLMQTGLKRKKVPCKVGCEPAARECVPILLTAHPYMRGLALHTLADLAQVETLEPSRVNVLDVGKWRPNVQEMQAVLDDWSQRCPTLLQELLLQLDYTPHTGLSLPVQLHIANWLCTWSGSSPSHVEAAWRVLSRLRTHRACWPAQAPPPGPAPAPAPTDLFAMAHALLCTEWGHSIPLICSQGVTALLSLSASRPREAVHCLAPVMLLMPQSPESVSLTPKFAELFTILLNCGPNLVQRALGRGGVSGAELLLRLVLSQLDMKEPYVFTAWLHALWKVPAALSILDIAALAVRDWYTMDLYATTLIQEPNAKEHLSNAVRFAVSSPLLCECLLRAAHAHEVSTHLFPTLVTALSLQRTSSQRIHVHNALQKINPNLYSEELVIYRCASAALVAPFQHPSHLTLWRLFFHIYLQRPRDQSSSIPCGPLFFSGIIKSRALYQIKKRLSETAAYHHSEAESYKEQPSTNHQTTNQTASPVVDSNLLPALTIKDLTGETNDYNDSDSEGESAQSVVLDGSTEEAIEVERKRSANMAAYHAGAEKMVRELIRWLDEGEKVKASPQNADLAWFIMPQALEEAWTHTLSRCRPPPSSELDTFPRPQPAPPYNTHVPLSPLQTAVASILGIKCRSPGRSLRKIRPRTDELDDKAVSNIRTLLTRVNELLKKLEKYAEEWSIEEGRISSLDSRLWELVGKLRAPRPLPPVTRQCTNKCRPLTFHLNAQEWCISAGAESGIRENRSASLAGIRRLTKARSRVARTAAALDSIARRIKCEADAVKVWSAAWQCARYCLPGPASHAAITALVTQLAERWIIHNGPLCHKLLSEGVESKSSVLQHSLCGSLVSPRHLQHADWPDIYITVLMSQLPEHTVFSFLSRFELSRWKETADTPNRKTMLKALLVAAKRPIPANSQGVLLELVGVHTALLVTPLDPVWLVEEAANYSALGNLPPVYWKHLNRAIDTHAAYMSIEHLNHVIRTLGSIWGGASPDSCERHATYSQHMADLLCILSREIVAAGIKLTYTQSRIFEGVWSGLVAAWAPWVFPNTILPHPPAGSSHYIDMLKQFCGCISQLIHDLPEETCRILESVFVWSIDVWTTSCAASKPARTASKPAPTGGAHVLAGAALAQVASLPWRQHQWFSHYAARRMMQIYFVDDEMASWCYDRFIHTTTEPFMRALQEPNVDPDVHLSLWLQILVGNKCVHDEELINQACMLPWWLLKLDGLLLALPLFLQVFCDSTKPYLKTPQVKLILSAAEFTPRSRYSAYAREKRLSVVSVWSEAYRNQEVSAHSLAYTEFMLKHITSFGPHLATHATAQETNQLDEFQELVCRLAAITLTLLPADSEILRLTQQLWVKWICHEVPKEMIPTVAQLSCRLTNVKCTGALVDNAVRMFIVHCEGGWSQLQNMWCQAEQPWVYVELGHLHAAYLACVTYMQGTLAHSPLVVDKLRAITAAKDIHYFSATDEVIIAVWICYLTRIVHHCGSVLGSLAPNTRDCATNLTDTEMRQCLNAGLSLLKTWGQEPPKSLIKMLTFQTDTDQPTPRHRLLVRLAQCLQTPSPEAVQAYESACAAFEGVITDDVIAWGRTPALKMLPMLATQLYPSSERFFHWELVMTLDKC